MDSEYILLGSCCRCFAMGSNEMASLLESGNLARILREGITFFHEYSLTPGKGFYDVQLFLIKVRFVYKS